MCPLTGFFIIRKRKIFYLFKYKYANYILTFYPYLNILTLPTENRARHSASRQSAKPDPGGTRPEQDSRAPNDAKPYTEDADQ